VAENVIAGRPTQLIVGPPQRTSDDAGDMCPIKERSRASASVMTPYTMISTTRASSVRQITAITLPFAVSVPLKGHNQVAFI